MADDQTNGFGPILNSRRRELGWTLAQLADRSGYSTNTVARVLDGVDGVYLATFCDVAAALGVQVSLLPADHASASPQMLGTNHNALRVFNQ